MIKINISFIFLVCVFFLFFFISKEDHKKQKTVQFFKISSKKELDKSNSSQENKDLYSSISSLKAEVKKAEKEEILNISHNENDEKILFKNADEAFEYLFPNLEQEWGVEVKKFLKYRFPVEYISPLLDPEQKKKYRELKIERFSALNSLISEPEEPPTKEYKEAFNAIKEHYLPKMINLLSKEQQKQLVEKIDQTVFQEFRIRKKEGKALLNPSPEEVIKSMSPQEIERLLNLQRQLEEEEALKRR